MARTGKRKQLEIDTIQSSGIGEIGDLADGEGDLLIGGSDDSDNLADLADVQAKVLATPIATNENERAWPKCIGRVLTFEQLCDYMGKFNELQWSHAMVYLYRFWPIILREPKYIDVITEVQQLSLDYIVSQFGGGKYKLIVTDTDRKDRKNVCEAYLKISQVDHEPILNVDELDKGHRDNRSYVEHLIAKGILDQEGNSMATQQKSQGGDNLTVLANTMQNVVNQLLSERRQNNAPKQGMDEAVITRSLDMMSGAYKTALDTAIKQGNTSEVDQLGKIMQTFQNLMQMMKPTSGDSNLKELLAIQADGYKSQLAMMDKMMTMMQANKNPDSQIDGVLGMIGKVKEIFGLEAVGGSSHKPSTLETIMEKAPMVLDPLARITENLYNSFLMKKGMGGVTQARPATASGMVAQTQALPAGQVASAEGQLNPENEASNMNSDLGFDPVAFVNQYGPIILQWINGNKTGDELAEWVESGFGSTTYLAIRNIGKEKMLRAMKLVPEYWQLIQPIELQVNEFIDQFISYADVPVDSDSDGKGELVQ